MYKVGSYIDWEVLWYKTWLKIFLLFYTPKLKICIFSLLPVFTLKDAQEKEVNKIASKRLEQQVLTLKAQLRDQAGLQNQFHDLQNEVELLQAQLCEKVKGCFLCA